MANDNSQKDHPSNCRNILKIEKHTRNILRFPVNIPWHTVCDRPLITPDSMINLNTNPFWIGIKLQHVEEGFIRIHLIKTQLEQICTALCTADLSVLTTNCQTSRITSEWLKSTNCKLRMPIFSQLKTDGVVSCSLERTIFRQNIFWVVTIDKPYTTLKVMTISKGNAAVIMLTDYEHECC